VKTNLPQQLHGAPRPRLRRARHPRHSFRLRGAAFCLAALHEALEAVQRWPVFESPHDGYGVLLEEVDELWDLVRKWTLNAAKQRRLRRLMAGECRQIAAMALRFALEIGDWPDVSGARRRRRR